MVRWSMVSLFSLLTLGSLGACGSGSNVNDYSAYITATGPRCGNGSCEPGDLCVDPAYQQNAGLCRRTPR